MEKIEYQTDIKYMFLKKKTNDEIKRELREVYGDPAPLLSTIQYYTAEFKRLFTYIFDEEPTGRQSEVTSSEMIEKICDIGIKDRRLQVRGIAKTVGISMLSDVDIHYVDCSLCRYSHSESRHSEQL